MKQWHIEGCRGILLLIVLERFACVSKMSVAIVSLLRQQLQQLPADAGSFASTLLPTKVFSPSTRPAAIHSLNGENVLAQSVGGLGQI